MNLKPVLMESGRSVFCYTGGDLNPQPSASKPTCWWRWATSWHLQPPSSDLQTNTSPGFEEHSAAPGESRTVGSVFSGFHASELWSIVAPAAQWWLLFLHLLPPSCLLWFSVLLSAENGPAAKDADFQHDDVGSSPTEGTSSSNSSKNKPKTKLKLKNKRNFQKQNKQTNQNQPITKISVALAVAELEFEPELASEKRPWTGDSR